MKRLLVLCFALLLAGCELVEDLTNTEPKQPPAQPQKTPEVVPPKVEPPPKRPNVIELPPKQQYRMDWDAAVNPLLSSLLSTVTVEGNNVLVIDAVKNNTKSYVSTQALYDLLLNKLASNPKFSVLSKNEINIGRRALGLPADDKLMIRSKVLGLARHLSAGYILSTVLSGDSKNPKVSMQLLLVQSGEIIWTDNAESKQVALTNGDSE